MALEIAKCRILLPGETKLELPRSSRLLAAEHIVFGSGWLTLHYLAPTDERVLELRTFVVVVAADEPLERYTFTSELSLVDAVRRDYAPPIFVFEAVAAR